MTTKCKANPRLNLALEEKNAIDNIVRSTDKTKYVWIDKIMKSIVVLWLWKRICLFLGNNKLNYLGIKSWFGYRGGSSQRGTVQRTEWGGGVDLQASPGRRGASLPSRRGWLEGLEGRGGKRDGRGANSSGFSDTRRRSRPSWGTRSLHVTGTFERTVRHPGGSESRAWPTPRAPRAELPHPSTPPLSEFRKWVNSGG